ncbi:MAG: hypothetical protein ABI140_19180 [Jatrophihabitantaceae bacterium]
MTWLWWLLAPVASTLAGTGALAWRAKRAFHTSRRSRDAMREHRTLLHALAGLQPTEPPPPTMLVLGD